MTNFLVLSASVVVLLGFCWHVGALVRAENNRAPVTWWHVLMTAVLCVAAIGLTAYMLQ
jgi:hypothetical protein